MAKRFEGEQVLPKAYDESEINIIRGKSLLMPDEYGRDIRVLCRVIDWFEEKLNECDENDMFGTEGWRHYFGIDD